ncbi:cobaltochelatase subunit CobN [Jannaschia sp. Os4]|uniref:cobaltochelatase subunit CobN n=1 Tax=Jannaschia sp. Os4 TaxID=2807617 RepID=UPI001939A87E|nr:cobaltochelatase subunit CobN [Jannaschia sp. Os4]MBM2575508.1 cobaltochelatase subunit CobN [Jannaschia sp. Os4]
MRGDAVAYRVAIVTLDALSAGPAARAVARMGLEGLEVSVHAAAEWDHDAGALDRAIAAVDSADIVICGLIFLDDHVQAIRPALERARVRADAVVAMVSDPSIVKLTRMGDLDMAAPPSAAVELLKKLRGGGGGGKRASGEKQMAMLRRLPKLLKFVPGKAQDLRAWFLSMQYWLGGSDENVEGLLWMLLSRYGGHAGHVPAPVEHPEVGLYHPDTGIVTDLAALPSPDAPVATVGLLLLRSYVLARDAAHYDAVIRAFEARGVRVIAAFAGGLDARPAIAAYHQGVDALVGLSGFSLVGGPAYNDSEAAVEVLADLDVPYLAAHPLEFQTLGQWGGSERGLGPVETTMLIALPEIDGATGPTVFAGRHGPSGCDGCPRRCDGGTSRAMAPCPERIERLVARATKRATLRREGAKRIGIVLFNFPPNAGAAGTAAYLGVWESLWNVLARLKAEGHAVDLPADVDALRRALLEGNAAAHGAEANVHARIPADRLVAEDRFLAQTEATWGPAPGRQQSDGAAVTILGRAFGDVFVGLQPAMGIEGDPMRLMFEGSFAPTHAFGAFYRWMRDEFGADVLLHFGMHGALEFMPGRQSGMGWTDWPDRLIGDVPNVYLYASNNPSEASLAKRRSGAVTVTHVTPPLAQAGLYKGLAELRDSVRRWREADPLANRTDLRRLIADQAEAVDLDGSDPDRLWLTLLETEDALIPDGLHVLGKPLSNDDLARYLDPLDPADRERAAAALRSDAEMDGLMAALNGRFVAPVPGGDLTRGASVLPAGRNIHAFDPFRMPTQWAMRDGAAQADLLLAEADAPRSVAMVLWGSDSIKSDGVPIAQALHLMGARPRFDHYGRLAGAELVPLDELGRPRIDVVMTLSGIFRDLLPLQVKLLAEAAWLAASADEPDHMNAVAAHARAYAAKMGCDLETAALRVFSNAEGAYGANVNQLVDAGAWEDEGELADVFEARKGFAYGRNGRATKAADLLQAALGDVDVAYQNLESVELGVTTIDHYFDTLGGISRAVKRAKGEEAPVLIGDATMGTAKVRPLADQVTLETRTRALNPRWFEGQLRHGSEGVRAIEAQVTNTLGWSATTGAVEPWVYQRISETFVLDEAMRRRLADLNPKASARMAGRLLEASERRFWAPDPDTLAALQDAADELEDRLEGVFAAE